MIYTASDVLKLGTILSVWAHPDDESWCMAGVLAQAAANGQRVVCVTATRGDAGKTSDESRWPQARLGEIREKELEASLEILGVKDHIWLNYKDGQLKDIDQYSASAQITQLIKQFSPDSIFSFGADGLTGHTDHQAVHNWTKEAIKQTGLRSNFYVVSELEEFYTSAVCQACDKKFNIYFATDRPKTISANQADLVFELSPDLQEKKFKSLEAHACQMSHFLDDKDGLAFLKELSKREAFVRVNL